MTFKRIPKKQRVEVDWLDACSDSRWAPVDGLDDETTCNRTLGYCLKRTRTAITVGASLSDLRHCGDRITIPRSCVKAIRKVSVEQDSG